MKKSDLILKSFINALGVFVYVFVVAWGLFNSKNIFGEPQGFLIPLSMLLLFIVSATITGFLVLGKPILLYLDGSKKEAFTLLLTTLSWLVIFLAIIISVISW